MSAIRSVILGTAGHVDHGKSSLVRALTGVDPDRLAEERERGMTIDLGFAPYRHDSGALVGMIDVPGHERFVKNMVAGATSVDVAILVVAADDGVMPQTREHLAILNLLGVRQGVVVLSKIDLVDADLVELARLDVVTLLAGSFLEGAPILPVDALSGRGLPEFRQVLDRLIAAVPDREAHGAFRLPVQRVFSAPGHGTVVTGVPVSGLVAPGDELELVGHDRLLRVRGVQAYGESRSGGRAGHSTALNVTGLDRSEVRRGDVLAAPGAFAARRHISGHYQHVHALALRNRAAVLAHFGTAELPGEVVLLDADLLAPGQDGFVQVRLPQRVVCAPGDRFLLRHAATLEVLGGGTVLASSDGRWKRFKERVLSEARLRLAAGAEPARLALVAVGAAGRRGLDVEALALELGQPPEALPGLLATLVQSGELVASGEGRWATASMLDDLADEACEALRHLHREHPLREWEDQAELRIRLDSDEAWLRVALGRDERIELAAGGRVRRRGHTGSLNPTLKAARERLLQGLKVGGLAPPVVTAALVGLPESELNALLARLRGAGEIVAVGPHWYLAETLAGLREQLVAHGRARGGEIDIPALRDELGTTRKYLIPLLEHFDAAGLTVRHGERRTLRRIESAT
ncbi:MAG: selenocysteine-specific translation elongation factor [Planctomycetota bacterium]